MAQLTVRNVDELLVRALRIRAAENGRSAEAEVRVILRDALAPRIVGQSFGRHLLAIPTDETEEDAFPRIIGFPREIEL